MSPNIQKQILNIMLMLQMELNPIWKIIITVRLPNKLRINSFASKNAGENDNIFELLLNNPFDQLIGESSLSPLKAFWEH